MSQVPVLSGDTIIVMTEGKGMEGFFSVLTRDSTVCTQHCNSNCTASYAYTIDVCITPQAPSPSALPTSANQLTINALSYNTETGVFTTMPVGTPITVGTYVGFTAVLSSVLNYVKTGPNGSNEFADNNLLQLVTEGWTVSGSDKNYTVFTFLGPASQLTENSKACANGYFDGGSLAGGTYALSSNSSSCALSGTPPTIYYGTSYFLQSVGYMVNQSQSQYWAAGNGGRNQNIGYDCGSCNDTIYTYHLENGQIPSKNLSTFSFQILAANGATVPGECYPSCVSPQVCAPSGSGCYIPGDCPQPCNEAAGWLCVSSGVCAQGASAICSPACGAGQICIFTNDGVSGGVGSTCVLNDGCGGSCLTGEVCKSGKCVSSQGRSWGFWALIILVVLVVGVGAVALVVFLVVVLAKRSKTEAPETVK